MQENTRAASSIHCYSWNFGVLESSGLIDSETQSPQGSKNDSDITSEFALLLNAGQNLSTERQAIRAFEKVVILQRLARKFWIRFLHPFAALGIHQ
jgi:hypothetical protein